MDMNNRPPYVRFETRAEEDRNASIEKGHYVARNVDYALITPQGSKDVVERIAEDWLAQIARQAQENGYPQPWVDHFRSAYNQWKETNTIPETGTPIRGWQLLSPAQQAQVLSANIRTVEDLAVSNESSLIRMGMGSRDLQSKARAWLEAAEGPGKLAAENAALKTKLEALEAQVAELSQYRRESNDKRRRAANE